MNQKELFDMIVDWYKEHPDHGLLACVTEGQKTEALALGQDALINEAVANAASKKRFSQSLIYGLLVNAIPADKSWLHFLIFKIKVKIILWLLS